MALSPFLLYQFRDTKLLDLAFTHRSFGNEQRSESLEGERDNERLEFLGDAILDLAISEILLKSYPQACEGQLSKMRAGLVNEQTLSVIAKDLGIASFIRLGKGEELTGGREKPSILASCFEALVAAIYLDSSYAESSRWIGCVFEPHMKGRDLPREHTDYKTALQEIVQAKFKTAPRYEVVRASGPDHDKIFEIQITINKNVVAKAQGKNKKQAEQLAAQNVLKAIDVID